MGVLIPVGPDYYNAHPTYASVGLKEWGRAKRLFGFTPGRVLDVGCGTAPIVCHTGVDWSETRIDRARLKQPEARFVCDDIRAFLRRTEDRWDTAACFDVLEHMEHPLRVVELMRRVARRVVAGVPINHRDPAHTQLWNTAGDVIDLFRPTLAAPGDTYCLLMWSDR